MATALAASAGIVLAQAPATPLPGREPPPIRVTAENVRLNNYLRELAGPKLLIGVMGGGVLEYLRDRPTYEESGGDYLAGRIASRAGQAAVQVTVHHGLAALMQRSTSYQPCACRGVGPKIEHALVETFTDRAADGSRGFSVPRFAGAYAGSLARLAWEPSRNVGDVVLNTTLSFGLTAVFNIARELAGAGR